MTSEQSVPDETTPAESNDEPSSESRAWAVAAHLVSFVGLSFVGPLIVWLIKREEDPFVEEHSREALNFQISVLIYFIVSAFLILLIIGIFLMFAVAIFAFVAAVVAAIKAANGDDFRYPLTIRLVKP